MQNRQEVDLIISSPKLGKRAYITTWCRKTQKYIQKISKKSHFKICQYVMPSLGSMT